MLGAVVVVVAVAWVLGEDGGGGLGAGVGDGDDGDIYVNGYSCSGNCGDDGAGDSDGGKEDGVAMIVMAITAMEMLMASDSECI